jgi:CRISPR system Cascade subunit CasB
MTSTYPDLPNFVAMRQRFENAMTPGQQAELRRAANPEDLRLKPALYRLFPGIRPTAQHLRLAFLLPWAEHRSNTANFGAQCAKSKVNEARLFEIARSADPTDMIQLRRVTMQIKPHVDWTHFGTMLWFWGPHAKRELIENYYLAQYSIKGTTE